MLKSILVVCGVLVCVCIMLTMVSAVRRIRLIFGWLAIAALGLLMLLAAHLIDERDQAKASEASMLDNYRQLLQLRIESVRGEIDAIRKGLDHVKAKDHSEAGR